MLAPMAVYFRLIGLYETFVMVEGEYGHLGALAITFFGGGIRLSGVVGLVAACDFRIGNPLGQRLICTAHDKTIGDRERCLIHTTIILELG